jgi:hypothetical protein
VVRLRSAVRVVRVSVLKTRSSGDPGCAQAKNVEKVGLTVPETDDMACNLTIGCVMVMPYACFFLIMLDVFNRRHLSSDGSLLSISSPDLQSRSANWVGSSRQTCLLIITGLTLDKVRRMVLDLLRQDVQT